MSIRALAAILAIAAPAVAAAQPTPKFEFGKREDVEKVKEVEWNAQAEAGLVFTTGNSETTTAPASRLRARPASTSSRSKPP